MKKYHVHWSKRFYGAMLAVLLGGSSAQAVPIPILEYSFNYTGTSSPSTGSNTTPLSLVSGAVHSAPGYGVGGDLVGHALYGIDRSFDNSASTSMGNGGTGGRAWQPDNNSIDSLMSMTLSGWFKTESAAINNFARIFAKSAATTGFELIAGNNPGELRLAVQGIGGFQSTTGYDDINTWVFFAVTYDGTEMNFYKGYRNEIEAGGSPQVTLLASHAAAYGTPTDHNGTSQLGNRSVQDRPFDGWLDNFRLQGSKTDTTGALSLADLETLRAADVFVVPEPSTYALLGLGAMMLFGARRLRRRRL